VYDGGPADASARHDDYLVRERGVIFVGTGAFLALYLNQAHHSEAAKIFRALPRPFSTNNYVPDELTTLLGRAAAHRYAADRIEDGGVIDPN
jgi:predicted nucleic acid-binding protein